jgi:hypothetical protein
LLPALVLLVDLAGRFDAGLGVVWDLLFMFTGEQLTDTLVPLVCLLAGASLAIIAANGIGAASDAQQLKLGALVERGRALEQRRAAGKERRERKKRRAERRREREERIEDEPEQPEAAQPEPARDPRMWSKPAAATARP